MSNSQPNRFDIEIAQHGAEISSALPMLRSQQYPPTLATVCVGFKSGKSLTLWGHSDPPQTDSF